MSAAKWSASIFTWGRHRVLRASWRPNRREVRALGGCDARRLSTGRSTRAWRTLCGRQMARNAVRVGWAAALNPESHVSAASPRAVHLVSFVRRLMPPHAWAVCSARWVVTAGTLTKLWRGETLGRGRIMLMNAELSGFPPVCQSARIPPQSDTPGGTTPAKRLIIPSRGGSGAGAGHKRPEREGWAQRGFLKVVEVK
jgi:hypothetical protein